MSNAWKQRTEECGGNIPSNVGLNGKPGGEYNGQWWKGTYGWNFTIFDGEIEKIAHRNYFHRGVVAGLRQRVAADRRSVVRRCAAHARWTTSTRRRKWRTAGRCCRRCTAIRAATSTTGRRVVSIHGPICITDRLTEIYLWSMDRKDLERVPETGMDRVPRRRGLRTTR